MLSLKSKAIILVAVPTVLNCLFLSVMSFVNRTVEAEAASTAKEREIISNLTWLESIPTHTIFFANLLSKKSFSSLTFPVAQCSESRKNILQHLQELKESTKSNPQMAEGVSAVDSSLRNELTAIEQLQAGAMHSQSLTLEQRWDLFRGLRAAATSAVETVAAQAPKIQQIAEAKIAQSLAAEQRQRRQLVQITVAMMTTNLCASLLLACVFYFQTIGRLNALMNNAFLLAAGGKGAKPLSPGDEFATIDGAFATMIESLQEMHKKEQTIADNLSAVVFELDTDGCFVSLSQSCVRNFGKQPQELIGKQLVDLILPEDKPACPPQAAAALEAATFVAGINRLGARRDFRFTIARAPNHEAYAHCVASDVTEQMEVARFRSRAEVLISERLKQPLLRMLAAQTELQQSPHSPQMSKLMDIANRNTQRMVALIDDLSRFGKGGSEQLAITRQLHQATAIAEAAMASVEALGKQKKIEIVVQCDAGLQIACDQARIVQILVNLLSNSIKFSPAGSQVQIRIAGLSGEVLFKVIDSGRGIPNDEIGLLFQEFQQVLSEDARVHGGSGIGLHVCKSIVEQHGGQIGAESTAGKGSTFWFTIPVA